MNLDTLLFGLYVYNSNGGETELSIHGICMKIFKHRCYLFHDLLDWPGLVTCIKMHHKQILDFLTWQTFFFWDINSGTILN
jgi:hypothetical protein